MSDGKYWIHRVNGELAPIWREIVAAGGRAEFGGAVALVQHRGRIVLNEATGWAIREPQHESMPMRRDTIFDLASLTKVVATMPSVLLLVTDRRVELDEPIGTYIPEFGSRGAKRRVTIRRLLAHTAGLSPSRPLYTRVTGIEGYLRVIAAEEPRYDPGGQVIYSCQGTVLLGELVRRVSSESIDAFARRCLFDPLGMHTATYLPRLRWKRRIAATEYGPPYEADFADGSPPGGWRSHLVHGEVHDGNAWYGLGGVSGNAGLFASAQDLLRYARLWTRDGRAGSNQLLSHEILQEAVQVQTGLAKHRRGLGWQMVPHGEADDTRIPGQGSARGLSARAFGHTGSTGTSIWIDPDRELVSILLTNRIHPRLNPAWFKTRAKLSEELAQIFPVSTYTNVQPASACTRTSGEMNRSTTRLS